MYTFILFDMLYLLSHLSFNDEFRPIQNVELALQTF